MHQTTAYDVQLRAAHSRHAIRYTLHAANGAQAQSDALERAAQLTAERGSEYRVARVDPS